MNFSDINLDSRLARDIENLGYSQCTPIQESAIPPILEGRDVAGLAQTGTGKTAAFLIPLIERILRAEPQAENLEEAERALIQKRAFSEWRAQNYILVLVPTRELAEQVYENATKLGASSGIRSFAIYGGMGYEKQKEALSSGLQILVATPGRLIDLFKENLVDLKNVRAVVFDEADRMFDMGFKDDMKYLLQRIPRGRQFLVFSATLNFDVLNTAYQFGAEPVEINISKDQAKAENVKDQIFHIGHDEKPQHLLSLLKLHNPNQAIIFSNYKHNVERIARFLNDNEVPAMAISSLLNQSQRNRVLEQFKEKNHLNILVATDVAARGLDVQGVDLVINYDLPQDGESYVHRIGRTGRAGSVGTAISLVSDRDVESLGRVEDYLKHKIDIGFLETDQLVQDYKPFRHGDFQSERGDSRDGPSPSRSGGRRSSHGRPERRGERGGGERRGAERSEQRRSREPHREGSASESSAGGARGARPARAERGGRDRQTASQPSRSGGRGAHHEELNQLREEYAKRTGRSVGSSTRKQTKSGNAHHPHHHGRRADKRATAQASSAQRQHSNKNLVQKIRGFFKSMFS